MKLVLKAKKVKKRKADPDTCDFNPAELRCSGPSTNFRLNDTEIEAIILIGSQKTQAYEENPNTPTLDG